MEKRTIQIAVRRIAERCELTPKQEKLDVNEDGKIDGEDLKDVRDGKLASSVITAAQQKKIEAALAQDAMAALKNLYYHLESRGSALKHQLNMAPAKNSKEVLSKIYSACVGAGDNLGAQMARAVYGLLIAAGYIKAF
jgi:hypothetical protein